ncbi:MAG: helix-turn-helix domain-containing protein [Solirubrobacterales bacterium]
MFNAAEFRQLLLSARANRTNEEYAYASGVSRAYISAYLNLKRPEPPSPDILKKLADAAENDISYIDLMIAAGHLNASVEHDDPQVSDVDRLFEIPEIRMLARKSQNLPPKKLELLIQLAESMAEETRNDVKNRTPKK